MINVLIEIALGSGLLILCFIIHLYAASRTVVYLRKHKPLSESTTARRFFKVVSGVCAVFLLSHTLHIYMWAASFWLMGALDGYEEPLYFALVTYTTLGYGDITLAPDNRVFGAMASVTGILMFGLTTAFLVGFLTRTGDRHMH